MTERKHRRRSPCTSPPARRPRHERGVVAVSEGEEVARTVALEPDDEEHALLVTTALALAKAEQTGKPLTLVGQWSDVNVYMARVDHGGVAWELGRSPRAA